MEKLMIPMGFAISVMSILILFINKTKIYIGLTALTLVSILLWMTIISSYDVFWGLLIYVLFMIPLLTLKFKYKNIQSSQG